MLADVLGTTAHNSFKSYFSKYKSMLQICCAHLLMKLDCLGELGNEGWTREMSQVLSFPIQEYKKAQGKHFSTGIIDRIVWKGLLYPESLPALLSTVKQGTQEKAAGTQPGVAVEETTELGLVVH